MPPTLKAVLSVMIAKELLTGSTGNIAVTHLSNLSSLMWPTVPGDPPGWVGVKSVVCLRSRRSGRWSTLFSDSIYVFSLYFYMHSSFLLLDHLEETYISLIHKE